MSKAVKKEKLLDDCVRNVVKIATPAELKDEENQKADIKNKKSFEFPSGYTHSFGFERFQIAESLFTPKGIREILKIEIFDYLRQFSV